MATGRSFTFEDGRVRLYTMNARDWTTRYPLIIADAARLSVGSAIIDAEVVCPDKKGIPDFDALHSRAFYNETVACAQPCRGPVHLNFHDAPGKFQIFACSTLPVLCRRRILWHLVKFVLPQ